MTKYEKEHKTFTDLRAHYEKEEGKAFFWSELFLGWETADLRDLLSKLKDLAGEITNELDNLLTLIEKRRLE